MNRRSEQNTTAIEERHREKREVQTAKQRGEKRTKKTTKMREVQTAKQRGEKRTKKTTNKIIK